MAKRVLNTQHNNVKNNVVKNEYFFMKNDCYAGILLKKKKRDTLKFLYNFLSASKNSDRYLNHQAMMATDGDTAHSSDVQKRLDEANLTIASVSPK